VSGAVLPPVPLRHRGPRTSSGGGLYLAACHRQHQKERTMKLWHELTSTEQGDALGDRHAVELPKKTTVLVGARIPARFPDALS